MFDSHLNQAHHADQLSGLARTDRLAGFGDDVETPSSTSPSVNPTSPAPVSVVSPQVINLLVIGGVALCLFLYLRSQHGTK
jgi:hypothetical protein